MRESNRTESDRSAMSDMGGGENIFHISLAITKATELRPNYLNKVFGNMAVRTGF